MDKLDISNLTIEVTRFCNLECIHCLRGDSENKHIKDNTINNLMKNINSIDLLTITGGEPLIAINSINKLIKYIKENNIKVENIQLITNGTILSSNTLKCLKQLQEISNLHLYISSDRFHLLELQEKNLIDLYEKNKDIYKELFNAEEYGDYSNIKNRVIIRVMGRANNLDNNLINQINRNYKCNYVLSNMINGKIEYKTPYIKDKKVIGKLVIDVNGNIVGDNLSFISEDQETNSKTNINNYTLEEAINNHLINVVERKNESPIIKHYYEDKIKVKKRK